jgi:hypothetical protein
MRKISLYWIYVCDLYHLHHEPDDANTTFGIDLSLRQGVVYGDVDVAYHKLDSLVNLSVDGWLRGFIKPRFHKPRVLSRRHCPGLPVSIA